MGAALGILGLLGFIVFLILLAVRVIRKKPKKPIAIGLLICIIIFSIGVAIDGPVEDIEDTTKKAADTQEIDNKNNPIVSDSDEQKGEGEDDTPENNHEVTIDEPLQNINTKLDVHFIDVGQADSIFIDYGDYDILIDAGNNSDGPLVVEYLKALNTDDIEIVVATHPHEDHIGGLDDVLNAFKVETIIDSGMKYTTKTYEDYLKAAKRQKEEGAELLVDKDMDYDLGNGTFFKVIETGDDYENTNDNSVITLLDFKDIEFLFTGDMEEAVEEKNLSKFSPIDVLKVGHHGSSTSTSEEFLEKLSPKYAVIQVGKENKYGHPHMETLDKFKGANISVYRTDTQGSVVATTNGKEVSFNASPVKIEDTSQENSREGTSGSSETDSNNASDSTMTEDTKKTDTTTDHDELAGGVEIKSIDLSNEVVVIENTSKENTDLSGWRILSVTGEQTFTFPQGYVLSVGSSVKIVSGKDATGDGVGTLAWGKANIWNNKGDPGILYDSQGKEVSKYGN